VVVISEEPTVFPAALSTTYTLGLTLSYRKCVYNYWNCQTIDKYTV